MEPVSVALMTAFTAAGSAAATGLAGATGGDAWQIIKGKISQWRDMQTRERKAAFDGATRKAIARLHQTSTEPDVIDYFVAFLVDDTPEARQFRQLAIEELVLSARPNIGRLTDYYRRHVHFTALLQKKVSPPWNIIEPIIVEFFGTLLPASLLEQAPLRPLLLEQAEVSALDIARATARSAEATAVTLQRLEALVDDLVQREVQPSDVVHEAITMLRTYRNFLIETYGRLDFRGIVQMQNIVTLPLENVYVPLKCDFSNNATKQLSLPKEYKLSWQTAVEYGLIEWSDDWQQEDFELSPLYQLALTNLIRVTTEQQPIFPAPPAVLIELRNAIVHLGSPEPTELHTVVRDKPFLVLLGNPGAGKSTLVRYLLITLAQGQASSRLGLENEWLPILFPVAAFAESRSAPGRHDLAPLSYLSDYYRGLSQPDYGPLFRRALEAGRALILFDGLDEVPADRLGVVRALEAFVREWDGPGNRFIATSRIAGYSEAPLDDALFTTATIRPLDPSGISHFVDNWSLAFELAAAPELKSDWDRAKVELERRAKERALSLGSAIFANQQVRDLASNPLLLTILALIHNQGTQLPDRRVELYRLCVEALAETWNRARSLSSRELDAYLAQEKLDERFVVNQLGPAALWMHTENPGGLVPEDALVQQIAKTMVQTDGLPYGKAQRLAQSFIDLVHRHTGLLQERGYREYSFLHLTFEEYLAARALLESPVIEDSDAQIHRFCVNPGWREVLRLMTGAASQRDAQRLILHFLTAPTTDETRGQPAVLAGLCLRDLGRTGATNRAWSATVSALRNVLMDPVVSSATRVEAGEVLGYLGDSRLIDPRSGEAVVGEYWSSIPAGPFWYTLSSNDSFRQIILPHSYKISKLLVTRHEYQRFVKAGGYQSERWWMPEGWVYVNTGKITANRTAVQLESPPIRGPRGWDSGIASSPSSPVIGVSWYEALAYCSWLTEQGHVEGWLPSNMVIRLPTLLEWQRAARHIDQRRYPWGDGQPDGIYDVPAVNRRAELPVGCFPAGAAVCGAQDMVGTVGQWTMSYSGQPESDVVTSDQVSKVIISYGGSSSKTGMPASISDMSISIPEARSNLGFRCVWARPEPPIGVLTFDRE